MSAVPPALGQAQAAPRVPWALDPALRLLRQQALDDEVQVPRIEGLFKTRVRASRPELVRLHIQRPLESLDVLAGADDHQTVVRADDGSWAGDLHRLFAAQGIVMRDLEDLHAEHGAGRDLPNAPAVQGRWRAISSNS